MEDAVAEGGRLGKLAIQADSSGDYKQAYFLYQECLKIYVEALKSESQEDRIEWTQEQILIRFERLAELHAWYKRKNLLEPAWLELEDLRDRLETVAPKISTKLRKFSYVTSPPQKSATPVQPDIQKPVPTAQSSVQPPQQPGGNYPQTPTSNSSSTPTAPGFQAQSQPQQYPPNPTAPYNGASGIEQEPRSSISTTGGHQVQPPAGNLGYSHPGGANGVPPPPQGNNQYPPPQGVNNIPPNPTAGNIYGTSSSPNAYGQGPYPPQNGPPGGYVQNQDPNALARVPTGQQQPMGYGQGPQPDPRTYLLTPFLRLSLPVKMYHCYGAAQRYRGGAEGWNIEIKDGSKNPIYYLYGLKQANAPLIEMSLHREDGKKTRCMDIYTPLRDGRQSYNIGDMSYKHYLPTPVDIYSQGETIPNGARKRVFTFNGRRFMWKPDSQGGGNLVPESLYEIDDGPQGYRPTQTNGLVGEGKPLETKLAWYEHTMARKKLGRINVVAGLELSIEEIFLGTMLGHLCTAWEQTRKGI